MVHIVRPVWEKAGEDNQLGRAFPRLTYTEADAAGLTLLEQAPRTVRGARDLLSVALQYGNAFAQGMQAAALKPADFFGNEDVLYLMEDMATGEIRLSILWEWLHKRASLTEADPDTGTKAGDPFTGDLFARLLDSEYAKLRAAGNRDVHDDSKDTTLPIAREIVETYVRSEIKAPWYIDLLNINLNNHDLNEARRRIGLYGRLRQGRHADHGEPGLRSGVSMSTFEQQIETVARWFDSPRFQGDREALLLARSPSSGHHPHRLPGGPGAPRPSTRALGSSSRSAARSPPSAPTRRARP
jgi:hypothetical protein